MTFVEDLAPAAAGAFSQLPDTRAVGWLGPEHTFSKGRMPPRALRRLRDLHRALMDPDRLMVPVIAAGLHECDFCAASGGYHGENLELYVRAPDVGGFEAPAMIVHYIDAHGYLPPAAFIDAVLAAPTASALIASQESAAAEVLRDAHERGFE